MQGGSFPCDSRQCLLHQEALQEVTSVTSRRDGQLWQLQKRTHCSTPNQIYYILCPCNNPQDYVGSTINMKRRWSKHKSDCRKENWDNCGMTRHFWLHHQLDMEIAISNLQVTLLDHLVRPYREEKLLQLEKDWILNMGTFGLNTRNQLLTGQRRNWDN